MKKFAILGALSLVSVAWVQPALAQSAQEQIARAVRPLPEELQAGAEVYDYDGETGERIVLRKGSSHVECQVPGEEFTWCYPTTTRARRDLSAKLRAEGTSGDELRAALAAANLDPTPMGSMMYRLYEKDDRIQMLWVVVLPNATSEELGLSTASQRDNALAGKGLPWMMAEGTPGAHLMVPINARDLSNAGGAMTRLDTKAITDPVAQAVLPLPEDLRDGATVVTYDKTTGARKVLRQGTNMIECQPRDPESGFTRCYHKNNGAQNDLVATLRAEGKSGEEIQAAVAAAREAGTITPAPFGSVSYRLYEENDRIKLLWVMRLPNAMPEDLGMSTGSQRDNALAGEGFPWMMAEGTPGAHLMIPINATELSNPR